MHFAHWPTCCAWLDHHCNVRPSSYNVRPSSACQDSHRPQQHSIICAARKERLFCKPSARVLFFLNRTVVFKWREQIAPPDRQLTVVVQRIPLETGTAVFSMYALLAVVKCVKPTGAHASRLLRTNILSVCLKNPTFSPRYGAMPAVFHRTHVS